MAADFENLHNLDDLSDGELRDVVLSHLRAHNGIDPDYITVEVVKGTIVLEGRVGTDYELRGAEHVVTDVVGIVGGRKAIVVQAVHRARRGLGMEDHRVDEG